LGFCRSPTTLRISTPSRRCGISARCQGRSKTRPVWRSKSRPVDSRWLLWDCGVEGALERSGSGPSTPRRIGDRI
jgi:hypothetical protein